MRRTLVLFFVLALAASSCTASTDTTSIDESTSDTDPAGETVEAEAPTPTVPATVEPTPTPEPTATTAPAVDESNGDAEQASAMLGRSDFGENLSPSELACVVKGLAAQPDLLASAISGAEFEDLALDDQVDTALIALDCAPEAAAGQFTDGFTENLADAQPVMGAELGGCLVDRLDRSNPDRRKVLMGFAALGEEEPLPPDAEKALIDTISTCVPGPVFAEWLIAEFADEPQMADVIDTTCVRTAFPDETVRQFWEATVSAGGSMDDVDPEATAPLMNALFSCMSMGRIVADQMAADGIDLSDETIACIDAEMADENLAAMMSGSDAEGEARVTAILIGCLSPEELAGLGG